MAKLAMANLNRGLSGESMGDGSIEAVNKEAVVATLIKMKQ
jgi:hypothetical protein